MGIKEECKQVLTVHYYQIYYIATCLWISRMTMEFHIVFTEIKDLVNAPIPRKGRLFAYDNLTIVGYTRWMRVVLFFLVPFVLCRVAVLVLLAGIGFIVETNLTL